MTNSRRIALPTYLVSFTLVVLPLADILTSLYPWRFGDARWRFGAVGLVSNSLLIPMVGLLMAFLVAVFLEHRTARRVIGGIALFAATLCVLALVSFALDAVQTRSAVRPEMRTSFNVASIAAAIKALIATITMVAIGLAAFRGSDRSSKAKPIDVPLLAVESPVTQPPTR